MTIQELKSRVDILEIAYKLGLHPDKNGKCLCPFHNDKNPSLQFSQKKQIVTCFSSNCDAGTMDVIGLVQKYQKWELPKAVSWLKEQIGIIEPLQPQEPPLTNTERIKILTNLYEIFESSFLSSSVAGSYLKSRLINHTHLNVGYNAGNYHLKKEHIKLLNKYINLGIAKENKIRT